MLCEPALEWTLDAEPTVRKAGQNVPALVTQHARGPFQVEWTLRNSVLAPWARSPTDTVDACAILLSQRRALRANFGMCYIEWDGHLSFVVAPDCGNSSEPSPLSEPSPRAYVARPEELFVFVINKEESEASSVLFRLRRGEDSQAVSLTSCQIGPLAWSAPSAERAPTHAICRPFSYRYGSGHLYGALSLYGDKLVGGEMADLLLRGKTPFSTLASVIFGANGA